MLEEKMLDCSWEQFEDIIRKAVDSDFVWKIRSGDTRENRRAVMGSIEGVLKSTMAVFWIREICSLNR